MKKRHASLFTGYGASELAALLAGWDNAFWCENNEFCRTILRYYFQNSKEYGNIKETSFKEWRGRINVLSGGFPCQPFSVAGKRKGQADDRYLWPEMLRAIREIRPPWVVAENVDGIISMVQSGDEITVESQTSFIEENCKETIQEQQYITEIICQDFEQEGYSVQPVVLPACSIEAPHRRYRTWFIAYSDRNDAGRCRLGETGQTKRGVQSTKEKWERVRNDIERNGQEKLATDSNSERLSDWHSAHGGREIPSLEKWLQNNREINRLCSFRTSADSDISRRIQNYESQQAGQSKQDISYWSEFPTQSPICSRNDGISERLDGITFPSWRSKSIEGFGNTIVPQLIFQIYNLINIIEDNNL